MKKYVTLTKDVSNLISEINVYLENQPNDSLYQLSLFHPLGTLSELVDSVPSLGTLFSDEGLTVSRVGHWCVDNFVRAVPCQVNMFVIPIANTASSTFNTHVLHEDAMPYTDFSIEQDYYDGSADTDIDATVQVEDNIFAIAQDTLFSINNTDSSLAQFLIIGVNEDISSFFAE